MTPAIRASPPLGDSARPALEVELTWRGGLRFEVTDRTGAATAADADAVEAGIVSSDPGDRGLAAGAVHGDRPPGPFVDGDALVAPSPMETLLIALGTCGGSDVVEILRKGRQDVRGVSIRLRGERRAEAPRRYVKIRVQARVRGPVERSRAERAVKLAFESYCSVGASLDPQLPVETEVVLEDGELG